MDFSYLSANFDGPSPYSFLMAFLQILHPLWPMHGLGLPVWTKGSPMTTATPPCTLTPAQTRPLAPCQRKLWSRSHIASDLRHPPDFGKNFLLLQALSMLMVSNSVSAPPLTSIRLSDMTRLVAGSSGVACRAASGQILALVEALGRSRYVH